MRSRTAGLATALISAQKIRRRNIDSSSKEVGGRAPPVTPEANVRLS
jgi:hypothetical protein